MIGSIILLVVIFGIFILAIVGNIKDNHKSNVAREEIRYKLQFIRIGMTMEEVIRILGSGQKIDYLEGQKIKKIYDKNERRSELTKNIFMDSNPYYHIRVPEGYTCLYYGGETYSYSTNGYRGTDTRTYWGISLYFKNGELEYTE